MNIHLYLYAMRTRDENKENSIREKAMEMIVKEGFDGLSMQKLAKAAGVSPATIYIYFKNREDLLNNLFNSVQQIFSDVALEGFTPDMPFEDGLWLQWKNRMKFILQYPVQFSFFEQFRNSPLINHSDVNMTEFKDNMGRFVKNAISRGDIPAMEPEVFWSIAYGSFYSMIRFHLNQKSLISNAPFEFTEDRMKKVFEMVIKALKK